MLGEGPGQIHREDGGLSSYSKQDITHPKAVERWGRLDVGPSVPSSETPAALFPTFPPVPASHSHRLAPQQAVWHFLEIPHRP